MEKLIKQLLGIAIILTGLVFCIVQITFDIWIPVINSIPWNIIGVIISLFGLFTCLKNR